MESKRVVLISGMSGAGKSSAMRILEDLGYYCIDNFPVRLVAMLVHNVEVSTDPRYRYMALSTSAQDFPEFLAQLNKSSINPDVLFLDASDAVLLHRYKSTRRTHPLLVSNLCSTLEEAIAVERQMFQHQNMERFTIIDTTFISATELKQRLETWYSPNREPGFSISFESFGYKNGVPMDADLMIDVRFLPNPYWVPELRALTGLDEPVIRWVMEKEETKTFLQKLQDFTDYAFEQYVAEGKNHLTVAIGCTGGQHRSVVITDWMYEHYRPMYRCYLSHRDVPGKENRHE